MWRPTTSGARVPCRTCGRVESRRYPFQFPKAVALHRDVTDALHGKAVCEKTGNQRGHPVQRLQSALALQKLHDNVRGKPQIDKRHFPRDLGWRRLRLQPRTQYIEVGTIRLLLQVEAAAARIADTEGLGSQGIKLQLLTQCRALGLRMGDVRKRQQAPARFVPIRSHLPLGPGRIVPLPVVFQEPGRHDRPICLIAVAFRDNDRPLQQQLAHRNPDRGRRRGGGSRVLPGQYLGGLSLRCRHAVQRACYALPGQVALLPGRLEGGCGACTRRPERRPRPHPGRRGRRDGRRIGYGTITRGAGRPRNRMRHGESFLHGTPHTDGRWLTNRSGRSGRVRGGHEGGRHRS